MIEGNVVIEDRVAIGENVVVKGPVYIGKDVTICSQSNLRGYVHLGNGVKVGSQTELKNSWIGDKTTFHKNYFGDSIIGAGCQFGAGTITANLRLDGENVKSVANGKKVDTGLRKLGAVIGENVKTGINVSLMPGVKIGSQCQIGPSTIVKEDIPNNCIYYTEAERIVKKQLP